MSPIWRSEAWQCALPWSAPLSAGRSLLLRHWPVFPLGCGEGFMVCPLMQTLAVVNKLHVPGGPLQIRQQGPGDSGHYNPPSGSLHTHFLIMLFGWDCQWASVKCLRTCVCIENFFCKMLNFAWGNISLLCALGKSGNMGPRNEQALTSHQLCGKWAMTSSLRVLGAGSRWLFGLVCEYSQHHWNVHEASSPGYLGRLLPTHPLSRGLCREFSVPELLLHSCSASEAMLRNLVWSWLLLKEKSLW